MRADINPTQHRRRDRSEPKETIARHIIDNLAGMRAVGGGMSVDCRTWRLPCTL